MISMEITQTFYLMIKLGPSTTINLSWTILTHAMFASFVHAVLPAWKILVEILETISWMLLVFIKGCRFKQAPSWKTHLALAVAILFAPSNVPKAKAEQVYDCSSAKTTVATYSLGEVGQCPEFEHMYRNKTLVKAQILQRSGGQIIKGYQCQLTYRREACLCSTFSHRKN